MTIESVKIEQETRALAAKLIKHYTRPDASEIQQVCASTVALILESAEINVQYMPKADADEIMQSINDTVADLTHEGEVSITQAMADAPRSAALAVGQSVAQLQAIRAKVLEDRVKAMFAKRAERIWQEAMAELNDLAVRAAERSDE